MFKSETFEASIAGRTFSIETGKLAGQANAAVTVRYGDTLVLVTVCASKYPREGIDFLPLTVDYEERLYAAGKIPGGFIRREGRPSEEAVLACRLTDRPIRPLLPKTWRNDIQIIATVLSVDQVNEPDVLALVGASAALNMSELPFYGPVGAVHVGYINGELVLNPPLPQYEESELDLIVASTRDAVVMLETGAKEVSEDLLIEAIKFGHEANQELIKLQDRLRECCGKPKLEAPPGRLNTEIIQAVGGVVDERLGKIVLQPGKVLREQMLDELGKEAVERLGEAFSEGDILAAFDERVKAAIRTAILERGERTGGRGLNEVRELHCEVGLLPRTHGSGMFTRGETQVLTIATLGSTRQEQLLDGLGLLESKRFMHHYNFPPFSSGEVKRMGSPGRREIGHGALAERALLPVIPRDEDFPYTIRLVSEVLSSSGSTSMASVCASSLSLMDAGIPIKAAVSGIAMGLVTGEGGEFAILTDIAGLEDAYGDMDFKVAGTRSGVTAVQMDTKLKGLSMEVVEKTLRQSRDARLYILDHMDMIISAARPEPSRYAPRMYKIKIDQGKIGAVIGTGGKTIRSIIEQTKTTIDVQDDGTVIIGATDEASAKKAVDIIQGLTREVEVGSIYTGKVTRILDFGAMVEILPGKEGLVHISELAAQRVNRVEDEVSVGDEVTVKVVGVDNLGRINLSRRALFAPEAGGAPSEGRPFDRGRPRGGPRYGGRPPREGGREQAGRGRPS
ncbi:MAG: polyribonucleotide nucleotidyltransferase [Chloroflexi bacterium]|nr:polyribonucleotide nucleotidyltransferase [Chloroflexota bacterium]